MTLLPRNTILKPGSQDTMITESLCHAVTVLIIKQDHWKSDAVKSNK